jgi:DNA adenine methylase
MKIYVPPIKCQGIKTKLVEWILEHPVHTNDSGTWFEPFLGSGVVGFNKRPSKAIFSDINPHSINFYDQINKGKINQAVVKGYLEHEGGELSKRGEEHYYSIRDRFNKSFCPLDYLFLNRACFNGVVRFNSRGEFNVPWCKKKDRYNKSFITKVANQVEGLTNLCKENDWSFVNCDFGETIRQARAGDIIYCDPPYIGRTCDYYNRWSSEEEKRLTNILKRTKAKFILSTWYGNDYRKNDILQPTWESFCIQTKPHFYFVGAKESNRSQMTEAIVSNHAM